MLAHGERVVITGFGAVSGFGWTSRDLWRGLTGGRTSISRARELSVTGQRTEVASEAPEPPAQLVERIDGWTDRTRADRFALAAALEAIELAGLPSRFDHLPEDETDVEAANVGVYFGGSTAGMAEAERFFASLLDGDEERVDPRLIASQPLNSPGDAVARQLGASGPVFSLSSACASGALAIGAALAALRDADVEVAIAGGADSLCQLTYSGFNSLRAVDGSPCRPFRTDRAGLSLGEGAGVVVLETLSHARARGATPLAEVSGAGASCDAFHMTAPDPAGRGAASAIRRALDDAALDASEIGFVNAHGTGTPHNDASEWRAIERVFGDRAGSLPVTSTKSYIGHLLGAAGAIEAVATVLCLRHRLVHRTAGEGEIDPGAAVDLVLGDDRAMAGDARALSTSFAFGGANAALVFAGWEEGNSHEGGESWL